MRLKLFLRSLLRKSVPLLEFLLLQLVSSLRYEELDRDKSPLVDVLFENVSMYAKLSSKFYWNVTVETENEIPQIKYWYKDILTWFIEMLKIKKKEDIFNHIMKEISLRDVLKLTFERNVLKEKNSTSMTNRIKEFLSGDHVMKDIIAGDFFIFDPIRSIKKFYPEKTRVFNSNTHPIKFSFEDKLGRLFSILYKFSDDLRQDQLIMQMISLMDVLLRSLNVDLRLTTYHVQVFSSIDGILEFVPDSYTLQDVFEKYNDDMSKYLIEISNSRTAALNDRNPRMVSSTSKKLSSIRKDIFDNYMESCASYCVITYLLGIGDRHLENLLIDNEGKLFHIDFGYAMGEDPKPYPPPFKLNKPMINGRLISV